MCHRLGNGTRLGSSKIPKSEWGTAMDNCLVMVVEIRKWTKWAVLSGFDTYRLRVKNRVQN
jgi:hypothetical protein